MSLDNTIKINVEGLERLMSEKDVVSLIHISSQNQKVFEFYYTLKCVVCLDFWMLKVQPHIKMCGFCQVP